MTAPDRTAWSPRLTGGDPELAARMKRAAGAPGNHRALSVALIQDGAPRFAALGTEDGDTPAPAAPDTAFEIGSTAKVLTGMLLSRLAERGTVSPEQPVAELLPDRFTGRPAGRALLGDLAAHRSGLPRLHHRSAASALRASLAARRGRDPYRGLDRDAFLDRAAAVRGAGPAGTFRYSNLGTALLGHALAAGASPDGEPDYARLAERELLTPLGMTGTRFHTRARPLPHPAALPHRPGGRPAEPWTSPGYAPSGAGVWSTARDLARLLLAVAEGRAPGADAARARFDAEGENRVGRGWFTRIRADGTEVVWHNGGTGGSASFIGLVPRTGRAVAVLSNTGHGVDALAARLLLTDD
ncbi:serine hydrolase domain-containing protein [Streptomyces sp. NPDC020141]|uniref:serine hydrolase domain-containing protein n=1 Tax=Streptomyces sp. NPDC020141 TaxID=3365065 RepID=UPI0037B6375D